MNTKRVNGAAGVILAALTQNRTAAGIALALESAGLLMTPETAADMASVSADAVRVAEESVAELKREHAANAALRARVAELEAPAAAQQRKGYEAAIEVMRQEKLPMSVGLLEAQLELNVLDGLVPGADGITRRIAPTQALREDEAAEEPTLTVFRASHESIVMGLYTTAAEARAHCEAEERRSWPTGTNLAFGWIEDEEDGVAELTVVAGQNEESLTGYVVTALDVTSKYDEEADE